MMVREFSVYCDKRWVNEPMKMLVLCYPLNIPMEVYKVCLLLVVDVVLSSIIMRQIVGTFFLVINLTFI